MSLGSNGLVAESHIEAGGWRVLRDRLFSKDLLPVRKIKDIDILILERLKVLFISILSLEFYDCKPKPLDSLN